MNYSRFKRFLDTSMGIIGGLILIGSIIVGTLGGMALLLLLPAITSGMLDDNPRDFNVLNFVLSAVVSWGFFAYLNFTLTGCKECRERADSNPDYIKFRDAMNKARQARDEARRREVKAAVWWKKPFIAIKM